MTEVNRLKPTDLTFQMYVKVTAMELMDAIDQMVEADLEPVNEGVVHIEPAPSDEEGMVVIFGIQASDVDYYGKDLEKLHDHFDLPEWPNLPIRDIEELTD